VALPLSAGRTASASLTFKHRRALLSEPVRLFLGWREQLRMLTVSCPISSAVSSGRVPIAFPHCSHFKFPFHTSFIALAVDRPRTNIFQSPPSPSQGPRSPNYSESVNNRLTLFLDRAISSTMKMEATRSSKTSAYNKTTWRHIREDNILHSHLRENL
jgi:hypothetical protein